MTTLTPPPLSLLDKFRGTEFEPLYTTAVTVTGGAAHHGRASGIARSDDGNLDVHLRLPVELGGSGAGTNPEQLFAAGYAACFHGALSLLAAKANISVPLAAVTAKVTFGRDPMDGLFILMADISVSLPGVEKTRAEELIRLTERFCPYAKMARTGVASVITLQP